jgi:hypothetical protein
MIMVHPQLRRVLATSALVSVLALVPVNGAHAAVHARAHKSQSVSSTSGIEAVAAWLRALLLETLENAGVRIDPDGNH